MQACTHIHTHTYTHLLLLLFLVDSAPAATVVSVNKKIKFAAFGDRTTAAAVLPVHTHAKSKKKQIDKKSAEESAVLGQGVEGAGGWGGGLWRPSGGSQI